MRANNGADRCGKVSVNEGTRGSVMLIGLCVNKNDFPGRAIADVAIEDCHKKAQKAQKGIAESLVLLAPLSA